MARMWRGSLAAALAVIVVSTGAGAAPGDCRLIRGVATPDDPTDDVSVCESQVYFHRADAAVANLGNVPSFDTTAPTAADPAAYVSVLGRLVATDNRVRPTFQGTFTGNIDSLRVEGYLSAPVLNALGSGYPLIFDLQIDGESVVLENPAAGGEQDVPMTATSEPGVYKMAFSVKNMYEAMESKGMTLGPDVQHTILLSMTNLYYGDSNAVHWFDSVSRPSGIYFNPDRTTGVVYDAMNY